MTKRNANPERKSDIADYILDAKEIEKREEKLLNSLAVDYIEQEIEENANELDEIC